MPIKNFIWFWWEIQILSVHDLDFLYEAVFNRGWQLKIGVNISIHFLKEFKIENFIFSFHLQPGKKILSYLVGGELKQKVFNFEFLL